LPFNLDTVKLFLDSVLRGRRHHLLPDWGGFGGPDNECQLKMILKKVENYKNINLCSSSSRNTGAEIQGDFDVVDRIDALLNQIVNNSVIP
jgi:hypothetical protein